MPPGSFAIYREATGGESRDSTSWVDETFDTTIFEHTDTFEIQGNRYQVKLKETGRYLIMYGLPFIANGLNKRSSTICSPSWFTDLETKAARGQGYYRGKQGCDEAYINGCGIHYIGTANQYFKLRTKNISTTTGHGLTRRANLCSLSLLKLDDTWPYARVKQSGMSPEQTLNTSYANIKWPNYDEFNNSYFSWTATEGEIKVLYSGYYLVVWSIQTESTSSYRQQVLTALHVGGSPQRHGFAGSYIRNADGCTTGIPSGSALLKLSANDIITLKAKVENDAATVKSAWANMQIVKLPDTVNKILTHSNFLTQSLNVQNKQIEFDGEQDDDDAFSHSIVTNRDNIVIQKPGHFLFGFGHWATRAGGTNQRYNNIFRWRKNGALKKYGNFGCYNRGEEAIEGDSLNCMCSCGAILPGLVENDIIECEVSDESTSTTSQPAMQALSHGLFGIYLNSIFDYGNLQLIDKGLVDNGLVGGRLIT